MVARRHQAADLAYSIERRIRTAIVIVCILDAAVERYGAETPMLAHIASAGQKKSIGSRPEPGRR
jgi:hypothetical protein